MSFKAVKQRERKIKRYGWVPDLPDARDHLFTPAPEVVAAPLPPSVNLVETAYMPLVYDQGQLGSCTANAIGAAVVYVLHKQGNSQIGDRSRLFIYYCERVIERSVSVDAGAMIRDGMKVIANAGAPPEPSWPYTISKFATKPPASVFKEALLHQASSYQRVRREILQMKRCLADGYPFVLGFSVYDSFESDAVAKTGVVPMPSPGETLLGGHAVLAVGYDDADGRFLVRNSWGKSWGLPTSPGYFTMPYAYLLNRGLSSDFWTLRVET